jgi:hypothetical protein
MITASTGTESTSTESMSDAIPLRLLAHARAGDKGNTSNIAVFAHNPAHYAHLCEILTEDAVAGALAGIAKGRVTRYRVDNLHALNFVITQGLEGGVNGSLNLDSHGKSWSSLLLSMQVPPPPGWNG